MSLGTFTFYLFSLQLSNNIIVRPWSGTCTCTVRVLVRDRATNESNVGDKRTTGCVGSVCLSKFFFFLNFYTL